MSRHRLRGQQIVSLGINQMIMSAANKHETTKRNLLDLSISSNHSKPKYPNIKTKSKSWRQNNFKDFPDAISRTIIKTGPTSTMMMAVYKTEEFAEKARSIADKFLKDQGQHLHDIIEFHGEVLHQE